MKALILDGPHQGVRNVPKPQSDTLRLVDPAKGLRPSTYQLYRQVPSDPHDFENGIEARFIWVP